MMYAVFIAAGLAIIAYCIFILYVSVHFKAGEPMPAHGELPAVSIIIPCRNEEKHISSCIEAISRLEYEKGKVEVIVVDDFSEDRTITEARNFEGRIAVKIISSPVPGKKAALDSGIRAASNSIIITTDADCVLGSKWLRTMGTEFESLQLNMLCGLVQLSGSGAFGNLQQAESAAIVGISAVMLNRRMPTTCNGAGLMFRRDVFEKLGGYSGHSHLASGDDDLLMQEFARHDMEKTRYILNSDAIVRTAACITFNQFLHQRIRWLSKRKAYVFPYNQWVQAGVFIHLPAFYILAGFLFTEYFAIAAGLLVIKYASDLYYAHKLRKVLEFKPAMIWLMPFYQAYILLLLIALPFYKASWKGRKL
jgi:biofilm PGA synthesis N-glycosyltransferase PgaC